jgi:hypothetical protein
MSCGSRGSRVERIAAVAATSPTSPIDLCFTTSITSDPKNKWIAHRQTAITAALAERPVGLVHLDGFYSDYVRAARDGLGDRQLPEVLPPPETASGKESRLSGESERIGEGDWDETVRFGKHVGYL